MKYNSRIQDIVTLLESAPVHKGRVLDIGVGKGELSEYFLDKKDVDGVEGIGLAIDTYNIDERIIRKGLHLTECSAEKMPFEDESFDVVVASHILEHVPNMGNTLQEIRRVMKWGGISTYFFLTIQNMYA